MQNYINSLSKLKSLGTVKDLFSSTQNYTAPQPAQPTAPISNVGATSTTPPPVSVPAKQAYTQSIAQPATQPTTGPITGNATTPSGAVVDSKTGGLVTPPTVNKSSNYDAAYQAYIQTLQPSTEEVNATKNLNDLTLQSKKDQEDALNKGETLGFATGEAARVNKNNSFAIDAATNTLNAYNGQRNATTAQDKARLDYESSLRDESKPFGVGDDTYTFNPASGQYEKTASKAQKLDTSVVNVGGNQVLIDNQTGKTIRTLGAAPSSLAGGDQSAYTPGSNPSVDAWISQINSGSSKITDVPAALKNQVVQGLSSGSNQASALTNDSYTSAKQLLDAVVNNNGFKASVGFKGLIGSTIGPLSGTAAADFTKNLDNLKSLLSIDNIKYLKGQGQISDSERKLLADAATQLDPSQSETQFKATLQKIVDTLGSKTGSSDDDQVSQLKAAGYTDEQIKAIQAAQ